MNVHVKGQVRKYENTASAVAELVTDINQTITETDLVFSHLQIDGVDVYENHYEYLLEKVGTLQDIHVILKTKSEVAAELQGSMNDYLKRALPIIEQLSEQFYQGATAEAWNEFTNLIDGLQWIMSALDMLRQHADEEAANYYKEVHSKLSSILEELMEATEAQDTVTIADMIQYEIAESLTELKQNVHH